MTTKERRDELRKAAEAVPTKNWYLNLHQDSPYYGNIVGETGRDSNGFMNIRTITIQTKYGTQEENAAHARFMQMANPQTILALLDQLDSQQSVETRTYEDGLLRAAEICRKRKWTDPLLEGVMMQIRNGCLEECAEAIEQEAKI